MRDKFFYWLFKSFKSLINLIPRKVNHLFAKLLGSLLYYIVKDRRKLAVKNIKLSLGYSREEAERLVKLVFQDIAIKFVETITLENWTDTDFNNKIKVNGLEYLEKAYSKNKGVIVFTGHIGNWDLLGLYLSWLGYPINGIARMFKNPFINKEILKIRKSKGGKVFDKKGKGVRGAFKSLIKKELLLILGDQDAHSKGTFIDFLNRPASTPTGPVVFAQKTGAVILPAYMVREGENYRLIIEEGIEVAKDANEDEIKAKLQELAYSLGNQVRDYPDQWLWLHRRWKTKAEGAS
ncbi:lauroyl acyltransferase [Orenia metallireducens]|jgi:KDO2-lipid IV(A) lauroyltransferase|uniref:Lauroyl acyltransferase n=1 Tax=Orenia metallireducens TaxID=1413210 RepID=A0A1C0A639_9FIRM|nr:lysophospholipid acyltransferase family protein [Orenia metallireducens]OCL25604.1 lauroyl acyltransferase [Orenia metallireducens]